VDYTLPPLPDKVVPLDGEDAERVTKMLDGRFSTPEDCPTCGGSKQFRWYTAAGVEMEGHYSSSVISTSPVDRLISVPEPIGTFACPCADQWMSMRCMMNAGIGLHQQKLALVDLERDEPRLALNHYSEHSREYLRGGIGLMMYGPNGNGKTMAAVLLAKELVAQGMKVFFSTFSEIIEYFASGWRSEDAKAWYQSKVRNAHFLVIDDIGHEMLQGNRFDPTNVAYHLIDDVLRHRYSAGLPTIMTTNDSIDIITKRYGLTILSLMDENAIRCHFTGTDWRSKARARFDAEMDQDLKRPIVFR